MKPPRIQILSGWQEIANYLGKGVRTVQRYEHALELPIHRPAGHSLAPVVAIPTELDNWVTTSPRQVNSWPKRWALNRRTSKLRANFLQIDSEIALTFCDIASGTNNRETRRRTILAARKAYDTIIRLREDVCLSDLETNNLNVNLARVKSELQTLGQTF